jgi:threonine 3-dehydrogenase
MSEGKRMKALVKKYKEPGIWLDEVPIPEIGINDVLIKICKTSICGTDIHIYRWNE